jgi:hypothetical protein
MNKAMEPKWIRRFILSVGGILLAAALIRFIIATGSAQSLSLPEPMLGIPLRYAVVLVGGFELTVALICLFGKKTGLQVGLLAWLATNFLVYWIGLFWMQCQLQGTCLGSLTDPLHLSRGVTGFVMQFLPLALLLGSYAALLQLRLAKGCRTESRTAPILAAAPGADGTDPEVLVRFLKISCTACDGHIEFPSHALGRKIPCPHCNTDITLKEPLEF